MQGAGGDAALGEERTEKEMTILVRMTRVVITEVERWQIGRWRRRRQSSAN